MSDVNAFKVLLINPRATYAHEIAQKCYPPLNLLYLATHLLRKGYPVRVLDANALRLSDEEIAEEASTYGPSLVGLPLYTEIMASVHRLVTRLGELMPAVHFVLGGPHASALPGEVFADFEPVEFILRGEAEFSLVELCDALSGYKDFTSIKGLSYRSEAGTVNNPPADPTGDLDGLGFPARDLVGDIYGLKRYYTLLVRARPVDTLITSRGCPFSCNFCYNLNHRYRWRSTSHVMEEILAIHKRGIRDIEICDDTFTCRRERAMEVFDELTREKIPVSFRIKSRVDIVNAEFVEKARRAGVYMISYGMESGDDEMLRRMNKRTTAADNERACRLTKESGIACHTGWIFGYPGETPESVERTINFIRSIKPTTAQIALLRPYPHTQAYHEAKESNTLQGDWSVWSDEYPWVKLPWTQTREDLQACVDRAVRRVYYRPYYVWQFGKMMLTGANVTLARYALQETRKSFSHLLGLHKSERSGSV
jgi:anaerobic magnesium-protoporphyrin IX monomethyl ester cyclase